MLNTQAIATSVRITGGNFRLGHRLFVQIASLLCINVRINDLRDITDEGVEAARSVLVMSAT
jgi:hypothetical protein